MSLSLLVAGPSFAGQVDPNAAGVLEPVTTAIDAVARRVPHTDQAVGDTLANVVGDIVTRDAEGTPSILGHTIQSVESPNDAMRRGLADMFDAASADDAPAMRTAARRLQDILLGTTEGEIYDGFAMLNFNRGAYVADQLPGEYKMKELRDTGLTEPGMRGEDVRIWEVDVNMLYYDGQIDSDTFLVKVPVEANELDTVRVHYRIFSTVREDFSPTAVMLDKRLPGSVQFPFKALDSVWVPFSTDEVVELTVALPPIRLLRGIYTWGWRVHPPRIQFLQPIFETVNAHTGEVELDPQAQSFAWRNRTEMTLDGIGDAAPEKKMYRLAEAALDGATPATLRDWMSHDDRGPRGTWREWADLAQDQRQLPPEAWDVLAAEAIPEGSFGPYRLVSVYMNNEMYGEGPRGSKIAGWAQGDRFPIKLINLDNHTHYFRNVDFGPRLDDDISSCCGAGSHSFEIMNFKGTYGIPKVAELQWRAGWGFRPHFNILQQQDTFSRSEDRVRLQPYTGGFGETFWGYSWSAEARGADFVFNPPPFVITAAGIAPPFPLRDADGLPGLVIGQTTEGMGVAQICPTDAAPGFCATDLSPYNPNGALNWPAPSDPTVPKTELRFPPFLRNPAQGSVDAGDIIPPTPAWKPFLFLNPANGTLFLDPSDPGKGYWVDRTYAHGVPIRPGDALTANIEAPRASAQVFYQFDDLFHDNAIFSPHPTFGDDAIGVNDATDVGVGIDGAGPLTGKAGTPIN